MNKKTTAQMNGKRREKGAALAMSLIMMGLMMGIAAAVLVVANTEATTASSDLLRTRTFYAASAGMEKVTNDFSSLFQRTTSPTQTQLNEIAAAAPKGLIDDGFTFDQKVELDTDRLSEMRLEQNIVAPKFPTATLTEGPFAGLYATVTPYQVQTTANHASTKTQVTLQREMNNYLIPVFQFGVFSDGDLEVHPGAPFNFNGRVHANGNFYISGDVRFLDKVTVANESIFKLQRNGKDHTNQNVRMLVDDVLLGDVEVPLNSGSVIGGPNLPGAVEGKRGYFPGSPSGVDNPTWTAKSALPAKLGIANQFGGQFLTRTTGAKPLYLPLQLNGWSTRELIKRSTPADDDEITSSRFQNKAEIRIYFDDEGSTESNNKASIPDGKGVNLAETNTANQYYFKPARLNGGKALWRVNDSGSYVDTSTTAVKQGPSGSTVMADAVRGIKSTLEYSSGGTTIPGGAGLKGRIYIEIVAPDGTTKDVTREILSMGMTVGEPNAIVELQRPLWAAFTQNSSDRDTVGGSNDYIEYLANSGYIADGEIKNTMTVSTTGFLNGIGDDDGSTRYRSDTPPTFSFPLSANITFDKSWFNQIVPITTYNVREGWYSTAYSATNIYERGMMNIVQINMRNLARWMDGVYDNNLLSGTNAVSSKIDGQNGYILYISDRRNDKFNKDERDHAGTKYKTTNGMVDNEDIYGNNGSLDPGEDVIDDGYDYKLNKNKAGSLQYDLSELPSPSVTITSPPKNFTGSGMDDASFTRAVYLANWRNPSNYFRQAVRLVNAENLQITGAAGKLSQTKGITVTSENAVYTIGNYNTTGITSQPAIGSTLNDPDKTDRYSGNQVPTAIIADAWFPLSKTWFDAYPSISPNGGRVPDASITDVTKMTAVRTAIMAGSTQSALYGTPDRGNGDESRLMGGIHNYPRFLENWVNKFSYVGSLIPIFRSTQAMSPYAADGNIYGAPVRNWAFDDSFREPSRLPPGTPAFQYVQPTGFRQVL